MEKIVQIVVSEDSIHPNPDQPATIINPLVTLSVLNVPTNFSFSLTIMCTGINFSEANLMKIQLRNLSTENENDKIIQLGEFSNVTNNMPFSDMPNNNIGLNLRNFYFPNEGTYVVDFEVDGDVYSQKFNVIIG